MPGLSVPCISHPLRSLELIPSVLTRQQFVRADFGALALLDDSNSLRLRGAGAYSSLKAFDLEVSNPEAATVAPVTLLLHVGRTKKAIVSPSGLQKLRNDPFFSKTPRSILVLPLTQQGRYVGVCFFSLQQHPHNQSTESLSFFPIRSSSSQAKRLSLPRLKSASSPRWSLVSQPSLLSPWSPLSLLQS